MLGEFFGKSTFGSVKLLFNIKYLLSITLGTQAVDAVQLSVHPGTTISQGSCGLQTTVRSSLPEEELKTNKLLYIFHNTKNG